MQEDTMCYGCYKLSSNHIDKCKCHCHLTKEEQNKPSNSMKIWTFEELYEKFNSANVFDEQQIAKKVKFILLSEYEKIIEELKKEEDKISYFKRQILNLQQQLKAEQERVSEIMSIYNNKWITENSKLTKIGSILNNMRARK